jgi:hypothetical protein
MNKKGFAALNSNLNPTLGSSIPNMNGLISSVRVVDIILDNLHPQFNEYGEWNGIGTIMCEDITINQFEKKDLTIATPLLPYLKNFPLVNEIVLLFSLPSRNMSTGGKKQEYYYLNPVNLWNHPHHNAYPSSIEDNTLPNQQQKSYQNIEAGSIRRITDESTEIELNSPVAEPGTNGGIFTEELDIHPLLPFTGDNIFEGRFGNSIRLGSTSKTKNILYKNNWSEFGNNGNPITILRNGQSPDSSDEGWIPVIENINKDLSSLYLTSNQQIPLSSDFRSYPAITGIQPETLGLYSKPQIVLNSGRLVLNTNLDSILLNSHVHIGISAVDDVGLFSRKGNINIRGNNVKLGGVNATEALILGDTFMTQFGALLDALSYLSEAIIEEPNLSVSAPMADNLKLIIEGFKGQLGIMLSKTVQTT